MTRWIEGRDPRTGEPIQMMDNAVARGVRLRSGPPVPVARAEERL